MIRDDRERCISCWKLLRLGELVHHDYDGGLIHADCCSSEPGNFYTDEDRPLSPNEPIPMPFAYAAPDVPETMQ